MSETTQDPLTEAQEKLTDLQSKLDTATQEREEAETTVSSKQTNQTTKTKELALAARARDQVNTDLWTAQETLALKTIAEANAQDAKDAQQAIVDALEAESSE